MSSALSTRVFWEHAGENAAGYGAAGGLSALAAEHVSAGEVVRGILLGALAGALYSIQTLRVPNGTASINPKVVAR